MALGAPGGPGGSGRGESRSVHRFRSGTDQPGTSVDAETGPGMGIPLDAGTEKTILPLCSQRSLYPGHDPPWFADDAQQAPGADIRIARWNLRISRAIAMIISQTPYRVSFAGGGTDLPAFYRQEYRGRPEHDDRSPYVCDDPPAVSNRRSASAIPAPRWPARWTRSSTSSSARRCARSRSTSRWRSRPSATSRPAPAWAPAAA